MHDWDETQDDYVEEDDAEASRILGQWEWHKGRITRTLRNQLDERLAQLNGPIRRHETGRLLYFLTGLDETTIAYLCRVPPFDVWRFFEPWPATASMCGHGVEVETRRQAKRPPTHCDRCAHRGKQQLLFELPPPPPARSYAEYLRYLRSPKWQRVRRDALRRQPACVVCANKDGLDVHHKTYERLGNERPEDVVVLCRNCHDAFHRHRDAQ